VLAPGTPHPGLLTAGAMGIGLLYPSRDALS
jgi:hypothetical protein